MGLPEEDAKRRYEELEDTILLLHQYRQWGLMSRTFMLREHAEKLPEIDARQGHFAEYEDHQLDFIEVRLYVELIARICQTAEDFAALAAGLSEDLEDFPENFIGGPTPHRYLSSLDENDWRGILRYKELSEVSVPQEDRDFLEEVRGKNLEWISGFVRILVRFLELHWKGYIRHKHAHSLGYGYERREIDGEDIFIIPVTYNPKKPRKAHPIIVSRRFYQQWQTLLNATMTLNRALCERGIEYLERRFESFAEYDTFFGMSSEDQDRLQSIINRADQEFEGTSIELEVRAQVGLEKIEPYENLYQEIEDQKERIRSDEERGIERS